MKYSFNIQLKFFKKNSREVKTVELNQSDILSIDTLSNQQQQQWQIDMSLISFGGAGVEGECW